MCVDLQLEVSLDLHPKERRLSFNEAYLARDLIDTLQIMQLATSVWIVL
jgi:hypothetical protein